MCPNRLPLLLLLCTAFLSASAQSTSSPEKPDAYLREHKERLARNPEGLSFTVRLKDNQKQFHQGEIIALELSFAAAKPNIFRLDAATYDRSGRLPSDGFAIDRREAVVDPLQDYFQSGIHGFVGGGLRGIPDLTDKPYLITAELNEWQRIEKPGHYRLYVVSSRLRRKATDSVITAGDSQVVSNVIEFDVLPSDKKWAAKKLNEAIAALAKRDGDNIAPCRILRFLGTPEAAIEMRKRFRGDDKRCEWEYKFGLIGSPHREFVIRELETAMSLSDQAVTSHFINTLTLLEFTRRMGSAPSISGRDDPQWEQWKNQMDKRQSVYDELEVHYLRQLVQAIPQKQGQARAISLQTLLDERSKLNTGDFPQWTNLISYLPEVFSRLPLDEQLRLLQHQWRPVASIAMLPVLREVFNYSYSKPANSKPDDVLWEFRQQDLRSIALQRIHELSLEEGRRLIIEEIRRPKLRVSLDVLSSLPEETLPEVENVLLSTLEEARRTGKYAVDGISSLVERYATDRISSQVQAVYESPGAGSWTCHSRAALLAYFLRVAPAVGIDYVKQTLAIREGFPRCYEQLLRQVAPLQMSSALEEIAISALDDKDTSVVLDAAVVLGEFGGAGAEKALWRRLEKSHESLQDQSEKPTHDQKRIETALSEALSRGRSWLADPEKLKRAHELCVTRECQAEVERIIDRWDQRVTINTTRFDEELILGVAQYEFKTVDLLKQKLLQFPRGTVFTIGTMTTPGEEATADKIVAELKRVLEDNGMKIKREPEQ